MKSAAVLNECVHLFMKSFSFFLDLGDTWVSEKGLIHWNTETLTEICFITYGVIVFSNG